MYDEYIPSDSPRLAPANFFTGREDIPRYLLNGSGNCRFAYVVVGQEAANRLSEQLIDFQAPDIMMASEVGIIEEGEEAGDFEENMSEPDPGNDPQENNSQPAGLSSNNNSGESGNQLP